MGLGLFIAKTLLERSGADLTFANGADTTGAEALDAARCGALVEVTWPRKAFEVQKYGRELSVEEREQKRKKPRSSA